MPINSFANKILSIPHLKVFLKGLNCSSGLHNSNKSNAMVAILKFKLLWKLTTFLHKNCCTPVLGLYTHTPCFQKQKYILITQQMPENCLFIFQLTNLMLIFFIIVNCFCCSEELLQIVILKASSDWLSLPVCNFTDQLKKCINIMHIYI